MYSRYICIYVYICVYRDGLLVKSRVFAGLSKRALYVHVYIYTYVYVYMYTRYIHIYIYIYIYIVIYI